MTQPHITPPHRRWYDSRPVVKKCLTHIVLFPTQLQPVMAEGANTLADRKFKADKALSNRVGLTRAQIAALYQTQQRRLALDQCPSLRRLYRYTLILPVAKGDAFSELTIKLMNLIARYLKHCGQHNMPPNTSVASSLTDIFVHHGDAAAAAVMQDMQQSQPQTELTQLATYQNLNTLYVNGQLIAIPNPTQT
jgi:hypothetical protein